jgi:hypothetical protein
MFMRIFSVPLALLVVGCSAEPIVENKVSQAKAEDQIECAVGGASDFARACAIERGEGTMLTLRHGDGGFRRLTLEADGTIDTADGADALTVQTLSDGRTEVTIGDDRYRLPATL